MNNLFAAKLLQNLRNKKGNKGFTLIELLVVVIIIGVLAAVALPNLLGQVGKARETEAKNGVGTINRAQQAYHFEKQGFSAALDNTALQGQNLLGVILKSDYFDFSTTNGGATDFAAVEADAKAAEDDGVRAYSAGIGHASGVYETVVCQGDVILSSGAAPTITAATTPACPSGSSPVN